MENKLSPTTGKTRVLTLSQTRRELRYLLFQDVGFAVEVTDPPDEPDQRNSNDRKDKSLDTQPD